jgi:oligopeptide/dipeptide ABC transporter ATP-binding protein
MLDIQNLTIEYKTEQGALRAAEDINLQIGANETHGLVGESGSGKTTVAKAIIGLHADNAKIVEGSIQYKDIDLLNESNSNLREDIRWQEISWIAQNAMNALDPVWKVGDLIVEAIQNHEDVSKKRAHERAGELLEKVGLDASISNEYAHELSGGQRQRAIIALALSNDPSLIIADEPTTGLDVMVQESILQLLNDIQEDLGTGILLITHDMAAVGAVSDSLSVMYGGQVVEQGGAQDIFNRPSHPYTIGLLNAFPSLERIENLVTIPGSPPDLHNPPTGCRFSSRCPFATEECEQPISMANVGDQQRTRCLYTDKLDDFRERGKDSELWLGAGQIESETGGEIDS